MGDRKARELDVMFLETSAKSGHNVKQVGLKYVCIYYSFKICTSIRI